MKCPRDGAELQRANVAQIELDKCHQCDGIWFDAGELEALSNSGISDIEDEIEQQYGDPPVKSGDVTGYMRCPRCEDGRLNQFHYTYIKPVKVDRCDTCLGIWLDKNELKAIIGEKKDLQDLESQTHFQRFIGSFLKMWSKK